ncbi:MAG: bifunctional DNA-binding transcriptional regulator/O6-methylguanine-DNA methyltransferase Ada [Comamonadaceae bacterium]|nr:MAG: bifunctional DNA-binding transcriptional regulator/O6-methylguanine-DNA methyltransferase Ada [Comamonadaceae bacterium]
MRPPAPASLALTATLSERARRTSSDPRWKAVVGRDAAFGTPFVYAVRTTGVYCRPSCGARTPRPENVAFFDTGAEATAAGFRPCKRCTPDELAPQERHAQLVAELCHQIESAETEPSLQDLATAAGLSTFHLHRVFKAVTGLTPKAYARAHRAEKVRIGLSRTGGTVTQAIYDAGYNANSRFYEDSASRLGMTPKTFRSGGVSATIRFAVGECSLGAILVAATDIGICAILLGDAPDALVQDLQDRFPHAELIGGDKAFEQWVAQVVGFVEMPKLGLHLPLDVRGTAFQQRVWKALQDIPPGSTASYGDIARRIGSPTSMRAVAAACAANALAVAIPCHRVVRSDGALSGYRWGVERKRALLDVEARA